MNLRWGLLVGGVGLALAALGPWQVLVNATAEEAACGGWVVRADGTECVAPGSGMGIGSMVLLAAMAGAAATSPFIVAAAVAPRPHDARRRALVAGCALVPVLAFLWLAHLLLRDGWVGYGPAMRPLDWILAVGTLAAAVTWLEVRRRAHSSELAAGSPAGAAGSR